MKKLDYLYRSSQGQYMQFIERFSQILELNIPMEPKSKKSISENDKQLFQYHVYNQMAELNRRAFRSPVIVKIHFYSTINNPPHIHTLTKNYLDLLSTPLDQKKIKRKNLLFKDDRQVEVLIVNNHIEEKHNKPSIQIKIMRYSNFVKDLKLIKQIQWNDFDCKAENPNFDMDELLERHHEKMFTDWEQSLETYYDMKDLYKKHGEEGEHECKNSEDIYLHRAQRAFLTEIDFNIINLVDLYFNETLEAPEGFNFYDFDHRKHWFSLGGRSGISGINIQDLPTAKGETKMFRSEIDKILQEYSRKFSFMSPLLINLSLLIIYISPQNIDIDLDNLARRIVPQINKRLQPAGKYFYGDNDRQNTPKVVTEYQVIKIPRQENDSIKGAVKIMLYPKSPYKNIWNDAQSLIYDWYDMLD